MYNNSSKNIDKKLDQTSNPFNSRFIKRNEKNAQISNLNPIRNNQQNKNKIDENKIVIIIEDNDN